MTCGEAVKKTCAAIALGAICAVAASFIAEGGADDYVWEFRSEHPLTPLGAIPLFKVHV